MIETYFLEGEPVGSQTIPLDPNGDTGGLDVVDENLFDVPDDPPFEASLVAQLSVGDDLVYQQTLTFTTSLPDLCEVETMDITEQFFDPSEDPVDEPTPAAPLTAAPSLTG